MTTLVSDASGNGASSRVSARSSRSKFDCPARCWFFCVRKRG